MTASPDRTVVSAADADRRIAGAIAVVRRRLIIAALLRGAAVGATTGLVPLLAGAFGLAPLRTSVATGAVVGVIVIAAWMWRSASGRAQVARCIEQRAPALRNELVTASEIIDGRIAAVPAIGALIRVSAATAVARLDLPALFPVASRVVPCVVAIAFWSLGAWAVLNRQAIMSLVPVGGTPAVGIVDIRIEPPAYTKMAATSLQNPDRITVIEGSVLHLAISSSAASVVVERAVTGGAGTSDATSQPLVPAAVGAMREDRRGHFVADVVAERDGYLAFQPSDAAGKPGVRRLVPMTVAPDHAPVVTLAKPGRDLLVTDPLKSIPLHADASDDLGLRTLRITYTKVSGSGETFTFTEGELPLKLATSTTTAWAAEGTLSLAALGLTAGDTVVYRAVATDDRPGAAPVESDAFVVEVVRPGELMGEGFAVDDTPDRYKLSQQMVIVKTTQLLAKKATLATDVFAEQAATIAAEQRKVRAEFVFMMGGELSEDEVALADDPTQLHEDTEAMGEADLMAGRMKNQGRRDLIEAIRRMSDAAASLVLVDVPVALKLERAALDALERAFSKSRYILRTIPVRERIDETRRLSGSLTGLVPARRDGADAPLSPRVTEIRRAVDQLTAFGMRPSFGPLESGEASRLSEALLRVDPRSPAMQRAAARLDRAAGDLAAGHALPQLRAWIDDAVVQLGQLVAAELRDAPQAGQTPSAARLNGALADAIRINRQPKRQQ